MSYLPTPRTGDIMYPTPDIKKHFLKHKNEINIDNFNIIDRFLENSELLILEYPHQETKKQNINWYV